MKLFLGIDAGNTKTIALVADESGRILGAGRSGPGDIYLESLGLDVVKNWTDAVFQAVAAAGIRLTDITAAVLSAAGADWQDDYEEILTRAAKMLAPVENITIFNDALGTIVAGCPEGWGVGLGVGTSLAVGSRRPSGEFWHASFWVDQGGADLLTRQAWSAVKMAAIGKGRKTILTEKVLAHFKADCVEDLLFRQTRRQRPEKLAWTEFAPAILDAAEENDGVAQSLVLEAGRELGEWAVVAAKKGEFEKAAYSVSLSGGLFHHSSLLLESACRDRIRELYPCAALVRSDVEPAGGAVLLAIEAGAGVVSAKVRHKLRQSYPSRTFYGTAISTPFRGHAKSVLNPT